MRRFRFRFVSVLREQTYGVVHLLYGHCVPHCLPLLLLYGLVEVQAPVPAVPDRHDTESYRGEARDYRNEWHSLTLLDVAKATMDLYKWCLSCFSTSQGRILQGILGGQDPPTLCLGDPQSSLVRKNVVCLCANAPRFST